MTYLDRLVETIKTKHVYIQTHNFPDPDAISSGFGLQYLLKTRGIDATICYEGKVDRANTRRMIQLFNIEVFEVGSLSELDETKEIILIDAQKGNGNTTDIIGDEIATIDHHPVNGFGNYRFMDVREGVGACASLVASYFFENNIEIPGDVAEALLYGVMIDTANMSRGVSKFDLDVFYRLFDVTDRKRISTLESEAMQIEDLKAFAKAIDSIEIVGTVGIANTGYNCPEALIGTVADFILKIEGVAVALVYSIRKSGIKMSVRCIRNQKYDAGEIIVEALEGIGTGGGHPTMAGGFVPIEDIHGDINKLLWDIINRFMDTVYKKSLEQ